MSLIELNLPAKERSIKHQKLLRRREMAKWRKQQHLLFTNEAEFAEFLDCYKWHKRPVIKEKEGLLLKVTFLDWKPPKKKSYMDWEVLLNPKYA